MKLGETLKDLRKKNGMTQVIAAEKLGITQSYLSQIETNIKEPSNELVKRYEHVFGYNKVLIILRSITPDSIPQEKQELYRQLKPLLDKISEFLDDDFK